MKAMRCAFALTLAFLVAAATGPAAGANLAATSVSVGWTHACAILPSGLANCWGWNARGELGDGKQYLASSTPVAVQEPAGFRTISVGSYQSNFSCGVTLDGIAKCWGYLPFPPSGITTTPALLPGLGPGTRDIQAGYDFACALTAEGGVACLGTNTHGQLGNGTFGGAAGLAAAPVRFLTSGVKAIAVGIAHSCALTTDGRVVCWGFNGGGILGNGSTTNSATPVDVVGLQGGVKAIATRAYTTCALKEDGTVHCWGLNGDGQASPSTLMGPLLVPQSVDALGGPAIALATGNSKSCAVMATGTLRCWGVRDYVDRPSEDHAVFDVELPGKAAAVSLSFNGSGCAILAEGHDVRCWGDDLLTMSQAGPTRRDYSPRPIPAAAGLESRQGLWWASPAGSESGWGLGIAQQGSVVFATWFSYDELGEPQWLVMSDARAKDPSTFSGPIYRTSGPRFDGAAWNPADVAATPVGTGTLTFTDSGSGRFAYTIGDRTGAKTITRQVFASPVADCTLGPTGPSTNYSDLWWASPAGSESGWGLTLSHQGDTLFAAWFTYGASGKGTWFVMSNGGLLSDGSFSGTLYRTRGPPYDASPWNPSAVAVTAVGSARLRFTGPDDGTFEYTVDGVTGAKPITRQRFGTVPSVCR